MILGRAREVELANGALLVMGGGPRALFVEGEPGIGKTTLIDVVVSSARERGFKVLRCRPSQSEVRLPQAGIIEALDGVPGPLVDGLPAPQRTALRVALRWDMPEGRPTDSRTVAAAIATLLRSMAATEPLLIAVDDLHWLDDASASAFDYALRRLEGLPVSLIAACRSAEGSRPRPMERAVSPERVWRVSLGPLDDEAIGTLLTTRLDLDLVPAVVRRIAQAAAGNPFLALEIGRAIQERGIPRSDERLPIPDDVRQMISARLRDLPAGTRTALLAIAAGAPEVPDAAALAPAEDAGIVRIVRDGTALFEHPLYESAIYEAAPAADRRAVHARLAHDVDTPEVRAYHLALAADGPDEATAETIADAAVAARARGAGDVAAMLFERAFHLTPAGNSDATADRALSAAESYLIAGQMTETRRIVESIMPGLTGGHRGRALLALGESRLWAASSLTESIPALEEALECFSEDPAGAASVHLALAFIHFQRGVDPQAIGRHAELGLVEAGSAGNDALLAEAVAVNALVGWLGGFGRDDEALARAVALHEPSRFTPIQLHPAFIRATLRGYTGHLAEALADFEQLYHQCLLHGAIADIAFLGVNLTTLAYWHGDPDAGARFAHAARKACEELGGALTVATGLLVQITAATYAGEADDARRLGAEAMAWCGQTGVQSSLMWIASALGKMELALGDAGAALRWLAPGAATVPLAHMPDPAAVFFVPDAVEAMILAGDTQRARELLDPYARKSVELGRTWTLGVSRRCRALLLALEGDVDGAAQEAGAAVAALANEEFAIELGRAYLVLGQIARRQRKRAAARAAFGEALGIFEASGARLWAARANEELGVTWTPGSKDGLTAAEQRVAELAATGLTNPEIAAQLFVSRRTVEATLSRIYRKLDLRSRTELARRFAADGGDSPSGQ